MFETNVLLIIISGIISLGVALGMFILKRIASRLDEVEERVEKSVTERQVRVIINDKIDPLRERMRAIESKLDQIVSLLLKRK